MHERGVLVFDLRPIEAASFGRWVIWTNLGN
jgi:hypothetical protein